MHANEIKSESTTFLDIFATFTAISGIVLIFGMHYWFHADGS